MQEYHMEDIKNYLNIILKLSGYNIQLNFQFMIQEKILFQLFTKKIYQELLKKFIIYLLLIELKINH